MRRAGTSGAVAIFLVLLTGCDPERGIRASRDLPRTVDVGCVERALERRFGEIRVNEYESDGGTFPSGTLVTQFTYYRPEGLHGVSWVEVGRLGNGARMAHSFTGVGPEIPQQEFPRALARMRE